ncbi:5-dehydro-4-deoxy-D-glucuronate isomerase [Vibrio mediterranei]|uniref:4-deoxy-L-threo-5-hexosulose-uronate ketol-isomerase n=1 Tax=Vibrio mediterranei TaxID=689 RepID=A0ABX5D8B5_9VIBR|nr:5-dehydro-4-deoxy-D-glucuronate isomerase [Vibrio mediterranei]MCG9662380.1 5-dehydro-4-deoxy-D-glucuronate isomerase [Vibrio mediterranei]NOH30919.1 5-dehydro-4-deoxy-D-glucuronate isomerase [Vibrio mediterranei]NOI22304.1 5-dehydro-4-deoxy-D-glucuronate isomerase [Vibrio mediterranei]PCD87080.1 5-dehydro-4-deoxy-D-glucuronate isomerase [Vibrio mediterranei]PRQ65892.1 5-dehydro-4-deoxy-D-glucuronate isomerase [Vibrio mediterranei]
MLTKYSANPRDVKKYSTAQLRDEFLIDELFIPSRVSVAYSHIDRAVALGICPQDNPLILEEWIDSKSFGTEFFLERRELGLACLEGAVKVTVDTKTFNLNAMDVLYVGLGSKTIEIEKVEGDATVYGLSAPAHKSLPTRVIPQSEARVVELGSIETANQRVINQYLHPDVIETCQLCLGITHLAPGSVWNTMPAHTHERRMEAYVYFNIKPEQAVFHMMGEPTETRHILVRDKQLVLSPSWSIHSGCGTQNYSFVWGMLGENQTFDDMDFIPMDTLA